MEHCEGHNSRRAAPRLALSLPGKFIGVRGNQNCIVTNLSCTGVLIAIDEPLRVGENGYLRCGPIDHFMTVARVEKGRNALVFDIPVSDAFVFGIRHYQEGLEERERDELMAMARDWISGNNTGHH